MSTSYPLYSHPLRAKVVMLKGQKGDTSTISVEDNTTGIAITTTNPNGGTPVSETVEIQRPTVTVTEKVGGGATLTVTDQFGTTTADIEDGVSVASAEINNQHLIITLTDGTVIDAGVVSGGGTIDSTVSTTSTNAVQNQAITNYVDNQAEQNYTETYTIASSGWSSVSSSNPYTYSTTVTATHTIGADTIIELLNDQPVLFANYGFAIASASGQNLTIYALDAPTSSITLTINYKEGYLGVINAITEVDSNLSTTSVNPVQNSTITSRINELATQEVYSYSFSETVSGDNACTAGWVDTLQKTHSFTGLTPNSKYFVIWSTGWVRNNTTESSATSGECDWRTDNGGYAVGALAMPAGVNQTFSCFGYATSDSNGELEANLYSKSGGVWAGLTPYFMRLHVTIFKI